MRCETCSPELSGPSCEWYGFKFCLPVSTYNLQTCMGRFTEKLWQAAKADKEAKQKAEAEATKAGSDQIKLVDYSGEVGTTGNVRDLFGADKVV